MNSLTHQIAAQITALLGGRSQVWLSDTSGIPRATLIRKLQGKTSFKVSELEAIAEALGTKVSDLIPEEAA